MRRLVAAVVVSASVGASPAQATEAPQTYVVPVCSTPAGSYGLSGWTIATATGAAFDSCASGQGFGMTGSEQGASWLYGDPANTEPEIVALRVWRTGVAPEGA